MDIELAYRREGNCLVPNLDLDRKPGAPLGKYGLMRQEYLRERRPVLWTRLCVSGELFRHLSEVEAEAVEHIERMLPALAEEVGATEELKAHDHALWESLMDACKARAEAEVLRELIFR